MLYLSIFHDSFHPFGEISMYAMMMNVHVCVFGAMDSGVIVIGPEGTIVEQFKLKMRLFIFSLGKACSIISLYSNLIIRYLEK